MFHVSPQCITPYFLKNSCENDSLLSICSSVSKNSFLGRQGDGNLWYGVPDSYCETMYLKKYGLRSCMLVPKAARTACIVERMQPHLEPKSKIAAVNTPHYACPRTYMGAMSTRLGIYYLVQLTLSIPSDSIIYILYPG